MKSLTQAGQQPSFSPPAILLIEVRRFGARKIAPQERKVESEMTSQDIHPT